MGNYRVDRFYRGLYDANLLVFHSRVGASSRMAKLSLFWRAYNCTRCDSFQVGTKALAPSGVSLLIYMAAHLNLCTGVQLQLGEKHAYLWLRLQGVSNSF